MNKQQPTTPTFKTYFQAESFLEMAGFHCENEQWVDRHHTIAAMAPKDNEIQIEFKPTQH